ncbi:hypothetical protein [Halobacteriovorax sp. DA5]|uniref:hypothetical protein n=1 Tax=Halobacteriovorax sp. DA5 TaxID=2067553 RepID=UPI000CD0D053|nr:hypothetical protein [Halobacteriovorax sp. DA5]POB13188.1 hypothetical protein C0Z22_11785 [Halobacteriovorax sp. DA5]
MNKLIAPLILILAFSLASCSKDTQRIIKSNTPAQSPVGPTVSDSDKVILNAKLGNFCEGLDCPEGIVAVKTLDKSVTCPGIIKSETEVLISQNCADTNETFHIQTTDGEIVKVASVEEELSNEFNDKVLKLTTAKEIKSLASISIPSSDNNSVEVLAFDKYGALTKQSCEITYASLAYANSFDNESQLLNIKNCDGVKDGSLISQDGNVIGFLTKKHDEIALYEGISLEGSRSNNNYIEKIDNITNHLDNEDLWVYSFTLNEASPIEMKNSYQKTIISSDLTNIKLITECIKNDFDEVLIDNIFKLSFNNEILEISKDSTVTIENHQAFVSKNKIKVISFSDNSKIIDSDYYVFKGDIKDLQTINENKYIGDDKIGSKFDLNNYTSISYYLYSGETDIFHSVNLPKCK